MTIDEAIEKYKLMATKGNIMFPKRPDIAEKSNRDYKQTADWLEELKYYQEMNEKNPFLLDMYKHDKEVYNKALEDFRKKANDYLDESSDFADFVITDHSIDFIIEELRK